MWDPKKHLVYIELGKNVMIRYTPMAFLKKKWNSAKEKSWAKPFQIDAVSGLENYKDLVAQGYGGLVNAHVGLLQNRLQQEGIILSQVDGEYNEKLAPDEFIVHVGFEAWRFNQNEVDLMKAMNAIIRTYRIQDYSQKGIRELIDSGIYLMDVQDYQSAMGSFQKAYYGASLDKGLLVERLHAMNDMAMIYLINNEYDRSFILSREAFVLSQSPECYDPVVKYVSMNNHAVVLAQQTRHEDAANVFAKAAVTAKALGEHGAQIDALLSRDYCLMFAGKYETAAEELQKLVALTKEVIPSDKDFIQEITELCAYSYKMSKEKYKALFTEELIKNQKLQCKLKAMSLKYAVAEKVLSLAVEVAKIYFLWKVNSFDRQRFLPSDAVKQGEQMLTGVDKQFYLLWKNTK